MWGWLEDAAGSPAGWVSGERNAIIAAVETTVDAGAGAGIGAGVQVVDNAIENLRDGQSLTHDLGRGVKQSAVLGGALGVVTGPIARGVQEPIASATNRFLGKAPLGAF